LAEWAGEGLLACLLAKVLRKTLRDQERVYVEYFVHTETAAKVKSRSISGV
jgi:hypothetical protein